MSWLCSPQSPEEMRELLRALERGPVGTEEEEYMIWAHAGGGVELERGRRPSV